MITTQFLHSVLDSITSHIAVIDRQGNIVFTNSAWDDFARQNNSAVLEWQGVNYLQACQAAIAAGDDYAVSARAGIEQVMCGQQELFYLEYPCHQAETQRWFNMRVSAFEMEGARFLVLAHQDITERKLAEQHILNLARLDGLTDMYNRRYFDQFLKLEWRRCTRQNLPLSLALIDIDHFKLLNDHYGHQVGDDCLKQIGKVLKTIARRPGDLSARYGGEEFALVLGNSELQAALLVVNRLVESIRALEFPNEPSPTRPIVTVSVGLACVRPRRRQSPKDLIEFADRLLYTAKERGRDQVVFSDDPGGER